MPVLNFERFSGVPAGTILHIGSGVMDVLPNYLRADPETTIVIVEPDPAGAAELNSVIATHKNVRVINVALAHQAGEAILNKYNLAELNGLSRATGAFELYPGLRQIEQISVRTRTPSQLLTQLVLREEAENWLIVQEPGLADLIFEELRTRKAHALFKNIVLKCGTQPLVVGERPSAEILADLEADGYQIEADLSNGDPDWCYCQLRLVSGWIERGVVFEQGADAQPERAKQTLESGAKDPLNRKSNGTLEESESEYVDLKTACARQTAKLDQAQRNLDISLRLQAVTAADLAELKFRYAEVVETKKSQEQLLRKLAQRLTEASAYLHGLPLEQGAVSDEVAPIQARGKPARVAAPKRRGRNAPE